MVNKIKIYKNFKILKKHQNAMILIGNFDGLHLGHQKLFKEAKKYKKKYNSKIGVVTFDPIPKMYFNKKGLAKISIGVGKGRKIYDKREIKKTRDWERQKSRILKNG